MINKIIKSDFNKLNEFVKNLESGWVVQVGIMGRKTMRNEGGSTNAEIGFYHEFGTHRIPKRSFLRMPIFQYAEDILSMVKKAGALKKLGNGKMIEVLADIGIACEHTILNAFASAGWGSWAPKKSGRGSPLIDTGQLRRSITSAVVNAP